MDLIMRGSDVTLHLNNKPYNVTQQVQWSIDYGEDPIYGIDSYLPQEISPTKISVSGQVTGLILRMDGGLQGGGIRPLLVDYLASPYISLRVRDRINQLDLLYIDRIKVTKESVSVAPKGMLKISFNFVGIIPFQALDFT